MLNEIQYLSYVHSRHINIHICNLQENLKFVTLIHCFVLKTYLHRLSIFRSNKVWLISSCSKDWYFQLV